MADDKKVQKFQARDFGMVQFKFNRWSLELSESQELESVFDGPAWVNLAPAIMGHNKAGGRGDIIEIRKLDTGLYAEVMIQEIGQGFVKVVPIRAYQPEVIAIADDVPFKTRWNVGKRSHEVIRRADNQVMAGGFQTQQSAAAWIDNHMKAMRQAA